ncbi:manganese-dependent inorganic pyrophosphatase [Paracoccus aerodenitrificans]|uniref:manganese-dependent inorganic pyrophosphatase n=1 Tax=Paracoccus aerodenitrificans TaxID=3017781 RepID=UPI0022F024D0|nr:manganese-dependent inorganic pyrophosphatase [Paracoccus aerodenitrificans]WBU63108.1 manganese-dependent inorganic pyrophosphatase [Paracoccus aerodenitrificans]
MITVLAHKSPDTDATGSPMIWAWYLNEIRKTPARAIIQGTTNTEAAWMVSRWKQDMPEIVTELGEGDQVVICDTNNPAELPSAINDAEILEIIDHHMLVGGLKTRAPINITIRPLACTATIMHDLIGEDMAQAPEWVKGVMLTCILSDTLEFRSPTTTAHDRSVAEKLAGELGLSIPDYASEMFEAKSDVSAFGDEDLLRMDSKEFELDGSKLRISVLETTAPKILLDRKDSLLAAMPGVAAADGVDQVMLFIVDILKEEATLLVPNDRVRQITEASFGASVEGDTVVLPGIMSRKKQIIPALKV